MADAPLDIAAIKTRAKASYPTISRADWDSLLREAERADEMERQRAVMATAARSALARAAAAEASFAEARGEVEKERTARVAAQSALRWLYRNGFLRKRPDRVQEAIADAFADDPGPLTPKLRENDNG